MRKAIATAFLRATGWEPEGERPTPKKFVLIAAPHTSNWDLAYLLALSETFDLRVSWLGKHSLFYPPLGFAMRAVGGIPVVRHKRTNLVAQVAELFAAREELALVVPAEGTRGYAEYWKSGFYRIAQAAAVPIVFGYLDYSRKRGGFGAKALVPSGDLKADMDVIRAFYADKVGKFPSQFGPVRLREEG
ncbi:MAG TPA: lysophospholipid acyltransferase family protein [Myxococcota bacterium]|nr:lysophospholipid acyltransferase family protein [Myxococcota bacterium]